MSAIKLKRNNKKYVHDLLNNYQKYMYYPLTARSIIT